MGGRLITVPEPQQRFASGATIATLDSTQLTEQLERLEQQIGTSSTVSPNGQVVDLQNQIAQRTIETPFECIVENVFAQQNSLVGANRPIVSVVETKTPKIEIVL
ncbi:hypothetical protein N9L06_07695, partial [Mariniblastus sp.]|nr:hypothetical protein [Mariniblastus sp.]